MSKLAVALMVKNEERIIERCLKSIIPLNPDLVIINDTGSTDATMAVAGLFLQGHNLKFKIYQVEFKDFGYNRTLVLKCSYDEPDIDYVLCIDADDELQLAPSFDAKTFKEKLNAPLYMIKFCAGLTSYYLPKLLSNKIVWQYKGVTHEFLDEDKYKPLLMTDIFFQQKNDSHRRTSNQKFINDIELLTKGLEETTDSFLKQRYTFYLGQSYYSLGDYPKAIYYFRERTKLGGWNEEIFYSYYQLGNCFVAANPEDMGPIISNFLLAYNTCPTRVESLFAIKKYCEKRGLQNISKIVEPIMKTIPHPGVGLFLEDYLYYAWKSNTV